MVKSYKLKCYANKSKNRKLNALLAHWQDQVNRKIKIFWKFKEIKGSYPPKEFTLGGRLVRDASTKAWQIVKGARETKAKHRPYFTGNEIDLNQFSAYIIPDFQTEEFDIWFNVINLDKRKRLKIPAKRTGVFNVVLEKGDLAKSFKLQRIGNEYYMTVFMELPEVKKENAKAIGIDVGLNNAIATSDGKLLGRELKDLRISTKHRTYKKKLSPCKQQLNRYAKGLAVAYPDTDFVVEDLLFKGKKKRSKRFRRRNNTWSYNHLAKQLTMTGNLKGFQVIKVDPAYSSQRCPMCRFTNKANRQGSLFLCTQCGYREDADIVGAINLVQRVAREYSVPERQI